MPTFHQLIRHGREEKRRTDRTRALDKCPQKEGVCPRVSTRTNIGPGRKKGQKSIKYKNMAKTIVPKFPKFIYSVILLALFLGLDSVDLYHALLSSKAVVSLGCRALYCFLMKMGCSGGLALAIAVLLKAIFTAEGASSFFPPDEETSGEKLPLPARDESPVPSISSQGDSWISGYYGNRGEAASSGAAQEGGASSLPSAAEAEPVVIPSPAISQGELLGESSLAEVQRALSDFLSSFSKIGARSDFVLNVQDQLGLRHASPQKLCQIRHLMHSISENHQPTSGRKAADLLLKGIQAWENQTN